MKWFTILMTLGNKYKLNNPLKTWLFPHRDASVTSAAVVENEEGKGGTKARRHMVNDEGRETKHKGQNN